METIGLLAGSGWASGINVYGVALLLGLFGRFDMGTTPDVLQRTDVLIVLGALYAVEFIVDKVPYLDNLWDAVHTIIRPVGAAGLGVLLAQDTDVSQWLAGGGSGLLALTSHSTKATARAAIDTSPEPFSNIGVSLAEDGLVAAVVFFAIQSPLVALVVVALLLVGSIVLTFALWRMARRGLQRFRQRRAERRSVTRW